MDESGELGGLETMETLTELGDELTLGDIDGEWWVGWWECGGARGGRGYGSARVRVRPPPAALASAGRISTRDRPGGTHPFRAPRVWAPARLSVLRRRVSGSRAGVLGPKRGAGGVASVLRERPEESARPPPPSRAYTRGPGSRFSVVRNSASHLSLPSRLRGRLWDHRNRVPRLCALISGVPGVDPRPGLLALRETLGRERLQNQVTDEASGGGGVWTLLSGMETRVLLLSRCKGN